jgi:hypothetical protein
MPDRALELVTSLAAKATPAERALLLEVLPPALASRVRYSARDAAVLAAFAAVAPMQPTPAAKRIATELARYLASTWLMDRDRDAVPLGDPLRLALATLARENRGEPIGWRQLLRIVDGARR